jgi:hypothetical protein
MINFTASHDLEMVSGLFAYDAMQLKWGDIFWAHTNGFLGWSEIVDIATKRLKDDTNLDLFILKHELARITKSNILSRLNRLLADISEFIVKTLQFFAIFFNIFQPVGMFFRVNYLRTIDM